MNRARSQTLLALGLALTCVIGIDLVTNELDTEKYAWDFTVYKDLAENGVWDNPGRTAPSAYRFATPLLAGSIKRVFDVPIETSFRIIAYLGAVGQLFGIFILGRCFHFSMRTSVILMLVTAFSMLNVKFLLFDVFRPDHLAYPLMIVGILAITKEALGLIVLVSVVGLQVREFLVIPPVLFVYATVRRWWHDRAQRGLLIKAVFVVFCVTISIVLPRALLSVVRSYQEIDPLNNPESLRKLFSIPLNMKRDLNFLLTVLSYALPLLLLTTRARLRTAFERLGPNQALILLYTGLVLLLAMYGGSDMMRFVTYLFIPQAILLGYVVHEGDVHPLEIIYMLVAVFIFNRILWSIPIWDLNLYLDFLSGFEDRINVGTVKRVAELSAYVVLAMLLRANLKRIQLQRAGDGPRPIDQTS